MESLQFRVFDVIRRSQKWWHKTHLFCVECGNSMSAVFPTYGLMGQYYGIDKSRHFICPHCGSSYNKERTFGDLSWVDDEQSRLLPFNVKFEIKEYKHFVDFIATYNVVIYNPEIEDFVKSKEPRYEVIRFDCRNRKVILRTKKGGRTKFNDEVLPTDMLPFIAERGIKNLLMNSINGTSNARKYRTGCKSLMNQLRNSVVTCIEKHAGYTITDTYRAIATSKAIFFGDKQLRLLILKTYAPDAPMIGTDLAYNLRTGMRHTWDMYRGLYAKMRTGIGYINALESTVMQQPTKAKRIAVMSDPRHIETIYLAEHITDNKDYQDKLMTALLPYISCEHILPLLSDYAVHKGAASVINYLARLADVPDAYRVINDTANNYAELGSKARIWLGRIKPLDLHDLVYKAVIKERNECVPLVDNSALEALNVDGFDFITPKTSHDLLDLGANLKNCVGGYKGDVNKHKCAIVACVKNGKPVVCIEVRRKTLAQAKLMSNQSVYSATTDEIPNAIKHYMQLKGLRDASNDLVRPDYIRD